MADKQSDLRRKSSDPSGSSSKRPRKTMKEVIDILPEEYEWKTCNMRSDEEANEVSSFLKSYYLEEVPYDYDFPIDYLRWALLPPGFEYNWHFGIQEKSTKQLVAFIAAVPTNMRLREAEVRIAEVKFLCILTEAEPQELQPLLIEEMVRRVSPHQVRWVAYTWLDNPDDMPIAISMCWARALNFKKLIDLEILKEEDGLDFDTQLQPYSLPPDPGFRKMESKDVPSVTTLLQSYLGRLAVAPVFNEAEVAHWFLPREDVVESYVAAAESENEDIAHFISFFILNFSALDLNLNHPTTVKTANSLYNVSIETPPPPNLLLDALILAKLHGSDLFKILDVMDNNGPLLKNLEFTKGMEHPYYMHDCNPLKPSHIGLVLF